MQKSAFFATDIQLFSPSTGVLDTNSPSGYQRMKIFI